MTRTKQTSRKKKSLPPRDNLKRKGAAREAEKDSSSNFEGFSPPSKQRKFSDEQVKEIEGRTTKKRKLGQDGDDEVEAGDGGEVKASDQVRTVRRSKKEEPLTWQLLSKKQRKQMREMQREAEEATMPAEDEDQDEGEGEDEVDDDDEDEDDEVEAGDETEVKKQKSFKQLNYELRGKGLTNRERKKVKGADALAEQTAKAQTTLVSRIYGKSTEIPDDNDLEDNTLCPAGKKEADPNLDLQAEGQSSTKPLSKGAKKKLEKQAKKSNGQVSDEEEEQSVQKTPDEEGIDDSIAQMDPPLLADHYAKHIKRHFGDLSTIKLDNKYLPTSAFLDTTSFDKLHSRKHVRSYIMTFTDGGLSTLQDTSEEEGSPHTLVIAASGLRASHLNNTLHSIAMPPKTKTAKLFAKHIKLSESVTFLQSNRITVGTGTPERLIQLMDKGALKTENLARIVIDGSYLDAKKRSIFDMTETFVPLANLLARDEIKSNLGKGVQVMVF